MADEVSKSGVFIDTKTGKVVQSQPEEGIQLVPPGGTIDSATAGIIDSAKQAASAPADAEPVDLSATDEGDTAKTVRSTRASK